MLLISYDVDAQDSVGRGRKRLRKIAKQCQNWGQRVQFSVFECLLDPAQWKALRADLVFIMDVEKDSLRFYFLGSNWQKRLEHIGAKPALNPEAPLIF